jgi:hypothetical protein
MKSTLLKSLKQHLTHVLVTYLRQLALRLQNRVHLRRLDLRFTHTTAPRVRFYLLRVCHLGCHLLDVCLGWG